jgi:uncharacterized membrane protein
VLHLFASRRFLVLRLLVSAVPTAAVGLLVFHLLTRGIPHSYDATTYVRSLWGVAHGDFFNPVVSTHVFGIHGQFVLVLLAPFVHISSALVTLVTAQAVAFGVTVWLVVTAFQSVSQESGESKLVQAGSVVLGALLVVAGTPFAVNPFLFDARPDLLGIPLVLAGLLRAERSGQLDRKASLLLLSSLLVREDYAMAVAPAFVFLPHERGRRVSFVLAGLAIGYWVAYLFGIRFLLGGPGLVKAFTVIGTNLADPAADAAKAVTWGELARYKLEILLLAGAATGGYAIRARLRFWLVLAPALLFLLGNNRLQPWVLNTHYTMFVAPGILAAGVAGFRRVRELDPVAPEFRRFGLPAGLAAACFIVSSALPGGGRFHGNLFLLPFPSTAGRDVAIQTLAAYRGALKRVPAGDGVAVPYALGPPMAERTMIRVNEAFYPGELEDTGTFTAIRWVGVLRPQWGSIAKALIEKHGFRVVAVVPERFALLEK